MSDSLALVNLDKVIAEIGVTEGRDLSYDETRDARECVWLAAERWLSGDINGVKITGVETEHTIQVEGHEMPFHGFVDVSGVLTGKLLPEFKGQIMIVDWKTREAALDSRWKEDLKMSWQWRLYAYMTGAKVFWYRGISRSKKEVGDCILAVPDSNDEECRDYLAGVFGMRRHWVESGLTVWPRRMPYSCNAFGRPCSYKKDCWEYTMPQAAPPPRQLSYSSVGDILLCPERHRRKALEEGGREETDATIFGLAVHRGMAEIYRQIKGGTER